MKSVPFIVFLSFFCCVFADKNASTPIVIWHGMGDSCCFPISVGAMAEDLRDELGVYVHPIMIGSNIVEDILSGYTKHPNDQIDEVCEKLSSDPLLADGFNAIGYSQGAQFLRGLVQRCPTIKVKNLISVGGQHQGVYGIPQCDKTPEECDNLRKLASSIVYTSLLQKLLTPVTYWHDPLKEDEYRKKSSFLADINNENEINTNYIARIQAIENFVMVKFNKDSMVTPIESEWFGYYKPGQSDNVQSLEESSLYTEDRLGLKKLNEESRLHFLEVNEDHLTFEWTWFQQNIIEPFLKN